VAVAPTTTDTSHPTEVAEAVAVLCDLAALGYEGIAAAVSVVREHTGLGTAELAIQVGLPSVALLAWEQGSFIPRTHHLLRLATILATHPTPPPPARPTDSPRPSPAHPDKEHPAHMTTPTTATTPGRADRFAGVIRAARQAARLSQTDLACGVGMAQSTVVKWERGQAIPTLPLYRELISVLGPWPLLEALLPPDQTDPAVRAHLPRSGQPGGMAASIRVARWAAGLTQGQVGVRVGVAQSAVSQWERGVTLPPLPMLRRLVGVLGAWPLLEALLPPDQVDRRDTAAAGVAPRSGAGRPSRTELARLIVQEGRSDQALADQYGQPIGVILRWRRGYRLERAAPPPPGLARPSRPELARLAIQQGRSDQELAKRYGRSVKTIQSWQLRYGLARPQPRVDRARLLALCRQGLPADQIAQQLGCTPRTVSKLASAAGVQVTSDTTPPAQRPRPTGRVATEGDPTDQELTAAEVAGLFQVSESAVHTWADQDRLPFRRIKGQRRFPAPAVARLAHQHQVPLPDWLHPATPTPQEPV